MELTHMSLCSGIGGIDLAAEWAGFRTIAQCETDEYASKVLAKNFKGVPNLHDIRTVGNEWLAEYGIDRGAITVLSAGFPCQPYSLAGKGKGDGDERDLWGEVARCIGEIKPRWFVGENTPGLFGRANQRYFKRILTDLAALGYSVGWGIWGACDVGAPHRRDRVFIVAYADGKRGVGLYKNKQERCSNMCLQATSSERAWEDIGAHEEISRIFCILRDIPAPYMRIARDDYGLSEGVHRLRCLGNAVVPQQIYPVFQEIAKFERGRNLCAKRQ